VGNQVPNLQLNGIIHYPTTAVSFQELKGKLIILDFWATWCVPCLSMMPKLDSLQKQFGSKIQIIEVAYQPKSVIEKFYLESAANGNKRPELPCLVNDNTLVKLFPHTYLPHFVWINPTGKIVAETEESQVTVTNISNILSGKSVSLREKIDDTIQSYNNRLPLLINGNAKAGKALIYHSLLTGYIDGLMSGTTQYPADSLTGFKITARNVPLLWLFRMAYEERKVHFGNNRISIELKDSSRLTSNLVGSSYLKWLKAGNGFCYELVVPPSMNGSAYKMMQRDLSQFFPEFHAAIHERSQQCWVLTKTSQFNNISSHGNKPASSYSLTGCTLQNLGLGNFIDHLNVIYLQNSPYPVIDGTGIIEPVDIQIKADLTSISSLNQSLAPYGLEFRLAKREISALYITEQNP
jgi:thiol-disulfide isomerase/thioredoxin